MEGVRIAQRNLDLLRQIDQNVIRDRADRGIHVEHALRRVRIPVIAGINDLKQFMAEKETERKAKEAEKAAEKAAAEADETDEEEND
jgi:hypothetical protein